jgi:signal transduction histidine kinase
MQSWKRGLGSGRRLVAMFLGVAVLLAGTLLCLGWQLARQDRELAAKRVQESQDIAADLAVAALQKSLAQAEGQLAALAALPLVELRKRLAPLSESVPADSVVLLVRGEEMEAWPADRLPFYPAVATGPRPPPELFAAAESLELHDADYPRALAALGNALSDGRPAIRGAALLQSARIHRKQGQWDAALAAYREMAGLKGVLVEGLPADLVAGQARLAVLEQEHRAGEARAEASLLLDGLRQRRWRLTRGAFEFYQGEAARVSGRPDADAATADELALAGAVESLHEEVRTQNGRSGRRTMYQDRRGMLALWRSFDGALAAMVLGPDWLAAQWGRALESTFRRDGVAVGLTDTDGRTVVNPGAARSPHSAVRLASATQLPWNLQVWATSPEKVLASSRIRQWWLMASMAAVALLILAGAWLVARSVARELAVSRLQSDFVSAVSHEFRTPLTSLCLLSEQLASGRISGEKNRADYYGVLVRESGRLRRLVEGLLNFGRMESGTAQYRLETIDPAEVVREVGQVVERDCGAEGRRVDVQVSRDAPLVRADRAALASAVWNLMDNAVKYSPGCATVWAEVGRENGRAAIRIRDRGMGIPTGEQGRIFGQFVRGEAAKRAGIGGTGVGLAIVRHIMAAHGGEVRLESKPGEGSSFTLLLPAVE